MEPPSISFPPQMNLIVICLLAAASMSMLPSQVDGGAPSTDLKSSAPAAAATVGEIWQEDDREVLIRNVRGAKNKDAQTGSASGKKGKGHGNRKNGGSGHGGHKQPKEQAHHRQHKNPKQNTSPATHDEANRKTDSVFFVFPHFCLFSNHPHTFPVHHINNDQDTN